EFDVVFGRAVAGFASDPQLDRLRVINLPFLVRTRPAQGRVTTDAGHVPEFLGWRSSRITNECVVARHPTLVIDQPGEGKTDLRHAAVLRRVPTVVLFGVTRFARSRSDISGRSGRPGKCRGEISQ